MCNINFKQYLLLKKLYKSKSDVYLNPDDKNFNYLLNNELIETEYTVLGPFTHFHEPNGLAKLTSKGESTYHTYRIESRRHWQNIFIPQTLNIIVSIITTVITYLILEYLKAP